MNLTRKHWLIILITPLVLFVDQISKIIIHATLKPFGEIVLIPGNLELIFVTNRGLIFGMFSGQLNAGIATWIFLGITIFAFGIIIHLFFRTDNKAVLLPLALSLVLAGALGNLIDRFRWGYVVDFINMHIRIAGREFFWPTYNIADIAIFFGIIFLIIDAFRPQRDSRTEAEVNPDENKDSALREEGNDKEKTD